MDYEFFLHWLCECEIVILEAVSIAQTKCRSNGNPNCSTNWSTQTVTITSYYHLANLMRS